jgi:glycosyltransferase involved in cell wall biosynthesis
MLIWIVNPFDPLPGDPEQEGRYAALARLLVARGHRVRWWTSSFSHRFKRAVDQGVIAQACRASCIEVEFTPVPPYFRNVGLRRVWSNGVLARRFREAARRSLQKPDVIVASSPPPMLAAVAVDVARQFNAKSVVDVQDLWPDAFTSLAPRALRPLFRPIIWSLRGNVRRAARGCDAIVGVADAYVQSSFRETDGTKRTATIPLGVDLAAFDAAAANGRCERFTKPAGEVWLAYTGSLNRNYDFPTILHAAAKIGARLGTGLRFFITSRGELAQQAQAYVHERGLSNVSLTGFLEFETWAYLLSQCDAGFNASFPEVMIFLPNKIFYYLAAGAAVLNTIPGQCSQIVRDATCGLDYTAGDVDSCAAAIERIVRDTTDRQAMQTAARRLAETTYDRAILFPKYVELIEQLGASASRG